MHISYNLLDFTVNGYNRDRGNILWPVVVDRPFESIVTSEIYPSVRPCTDWYRLGRLKVHHVIRGKILPNHQNFDYFADLSGADSDVQSLDFSLLVETRINVQLDDDVRLFNAALAKMNKKKNLLATQVGISLLESKESFMLLKNTIVKITKAVHACKKGNVLEAYFILIGKKPSKKKSVILLNLQGFSNIWLELRYGWQPLIYLIQDILKDFSTSGTLGIKPNAVNHFRGVAWNGFSEVHNLYVPALGTVKIETSIKQGWRMAEWMYCKEPQLNSDFVERMIKNILKPESTLVEAIPLSFVANWFIPIEDWAKSFSQNIYDETFLTASATNFVSFNGASVYSASTGIQCENLSSQELNGSSFRRDAKKVPLSLRFELSNGLNIERVIDSLALAVGILTKVSSKKRKK